jgi:aspartyl-tRNA(Asn)/glutamyl-tRNA(Gln) amidotransferase subunit A
MDPISAEAGGIAGFGERLRRRETSAEQAAAAYLQRIRRHEPRLGAFQCVASDDAVLADARRVDALLASGTDLGPLMGVPVAIKDIVRVDGFPTPTVGSRIPPDVIESIVGGSEGPLLQRIRAAGCIVLGKLKTSEFAYRIDGINRAFGTPRNPHAANGELRLPGGSSSGSAVATAAGLTGFAIGTDTGGSVRCPAALCGVVGLKTTVGRWETQGMFPLSPVFDSVGALTRTAQDAAIVLSELTPSRPGSSLCCLCSGRTTAADEDEAAEVQQLLEAGAGGLRLGRLQLPSLWADCEPVVLRSVEAALSALRAAGARVDDARLPSSVGAAVDRPAILPVDLLATLGADTFRAVRGEVDPAIAQRLERVLTASTGSVRNQRSSEDAYASAVGAARQSASRVARWFHDEAGGGFDALVCPTTLICASVLSQESKADPLAEAETAALLLRNTAIANDCGLCAISIPVQQQCAEGRLPVGLQLLGPAGSDAKLAAVAVCIEAVLGSGPPPPEDTG